MTKPKNIGPRRHLKIVGEGNETQVVEVPQVTITPLRFDSVQFAYQFHPEAGNLLMLQLVLDGKPLFIPSIPIDASHVSVRIKPQLFVGLSTDEAQALYDEYVEAAKKQASDALWKPGMPLPQGIKLH